MINANVVRGGWRSPGQPLYVMLIFLMLLLWVFGVGFGLHAQAQPPTDEAPITVIDFFGNEVTIQDSSRIITLGGAVAEVLYALGVGDRIIARDDSSIYPEQVTSLPSVGYLRFLSAEPVLALAPSLIIATQDAGPPEAVAQLQQSGVTFLVVPAENTLEGAVEKIRAIAAAVNRMTEAEAIIADLQADIAEAQALRQQVQDTPRVMFVFVRGPAVLTVSGVETGANEMLRLAGAQNVFDHKGYISMTAEAVVAAAPEIIVTTNLGVESIGTLENFLRLPGVAQTPAAQNGRIIYENLDDVYLLGFTPRLGKAILELTYLLHPDIPRPIPAVVQIDLSNRILAEMIDEAGLKQTLRTVGPYTLFAPSEALLESLNMNMNTIQAQDAALLADLLNDHVLDGIYNLYDLSMRLNGRTLEARSGLPLRLGLDEDGNLLLNDRVRVIEGDIQAANGIIHLIDVLLTPE